MHRKHHKDGLEVVAVSFDNPKFKNEVVDFVKSVNARYTHVLLDEPAEFYQEKLRFLFFPCYYVFDRQGRWTQFSSDEDTVDYEAMDALVLRLLKEK